MVGSCRLRGARSSGVAFTQGLTTCGAAWGMRLMVSKRSVKRIWRKGGGLDQSGGCKRIWCWRFLLMIILVRQLNSRDETGPVYDSSAVNGRIRLDEDGNLIVARTKEPFHFGIAP
jgi:hypothetical protein